MGLWEFAWNVWFSLVCGKCLSNFCGRVNRILYVMVRCLKNLHLEHKGLWVHYFRLKNRKKLNATDKTFITIVYLLRDFNTIIIHCINRQRSKCSTVKQACYIMTWIVGNRSYILFLRLLTFKWKISWTLLCMHKGPGFNATSPDNSKVKNTICMTKFIYNDKAAVHWKPLLRNLDIL